MKVIKFGAVWCAHCLIMRPRWAEIEKENPWLKTEYYDIDESPKIAQKFNITKDIPVFVFLDKNEKEIMRLRGDISKKELIKTINEYKDK